MIDVGIIEQLTPPDIPPQVFLEPKVESTLKEYPELRSLVSWSNFAQAKLRDYMKGYAIESRNPDHPPIVRHFFEAFGIGIGILDVDQTFPSYERSAFPVLKGYRFGIAIYRTWLSHSGGEYEFPQDFDLPTDLDEPFPANIPVVVYEADITDHLHPKGGFSSIVVEIDKQLAVMTARHVVGGTPRRGTVPISCLVHDACYATVYAKGSASIDAALLIPRDIDCLLLRQSFSLRNSHQLALQGLTISHHFGTQLAPSLATIMQGFQSQQAILAAVQPRNFISTGNGVNGDSGSAISTDHTNDDFKMVGMYLGSAGTRLANGRSVDQAFGLELDQPLRMFNAQLIGAFLK